MQGIADILKRKDFDVPPEVEAIKAYVRRHYDTEVAVTVLPREFVISAPSSGLIASLRLNVTALQKAANTDKRISFRIG
jgi:hypothetical protein